MNAILQVCDRLEESIRKFLETIPGQGRFILVGEPKFIAIKTMIALFREEGWEVNYDCNERYEWLMFRKKMPFLLTYNGID